MMQVFRVQRTLLGKMISNRDGVKWRNCTVATTCRLLLAKKPKLDYDELQITAEGNEINLLTSKTPLLNKQGEVTGIVGTYLDITKRTKAELALKESENKLIQLNADKNLFISILGHDLRSPFHGTSGFSELLLENIHKYHCWRN